MVFTILFILIPIIYLFLISATEKEESGIVGFNLWGGLLILLIFMLSFIFVESGDKTLYLENYLDAENYFENYDRELLWGKLQIFLSKAFFKNEIIYWLFYSFFYCIAYYIVAKKFFPYQYAGYFVLCVVACMGFVAYGSNTIRAGFGIALLLMAFCADNKPVKVMLAVASVGCHMSMLLPVVSYLSTLYIIKKERWCEIIWILFLVITVMTSVVSDIMSVLGSLDSRADEFANADGTHDIYNVGFKYNFLLYSAVPILFAKYNLKHLNVENHIYSHVYRIYLLSNAVWLLLIRIPYTDRIAYLSWFMIPFLLLYPVLNGQLDTPHPQRYIFRAIITFMLVNIVLSLK